MNVVNAPQLLSARRASGITRTPWTELRDLLERAGFRVVKLGNRELVAETDLAALIEKGRQLTVAESADRVGLAMQLALDEMKLEGKRARRRKGNAAALQPPAGQVQAGDCDRQP